MHIERVPDLLAISSINDPAFLRHAEHACEAAHTRLLPPRIANHEPRTHGTNAETRSASPENIDFSGVAPFLIYFATRLTVNARMRMRMRMRSPPPYSGTQARSGWVSRGSPAPPPSRIHEARRLRTLFLSRTPPSVSYFICSWIRAYLLGRSGASKGRTLTTSRGPLRTTPWLGIHIRGGALISSCYLTCLVLKYGTCGLGALSLSDSVSDWVEYLTTRL